MKVSLKVTKGPEKGKLFEFDKPATFLVGRAKDCHFTLSSDDPYISRRHFLIEICPPKCVLTDLNSANPPRINGKIVSEHELHDSDVIEVGYTHLQVLISHEIRTAKCKKCGKAIPLAGDDIAPDYCDECIVADIKYGQTQKILCKCGADLSDKANSDGRAAELMGEAQYVCENCVIKECDNEAHEQSLSLSKYGYRILRGLGGGGMGIVFLVHHVKTCRLLALKLIKDLNNAELVKRFERECRLNKELIHENLIKYVDSGICGKYPYLVMQYASGGHLGDVLLERDGPFNPVEAVGHMTDVLTALEFMHNHKIIHRDIKPENIVLMKTTSGKFIPKITDFGLAKKYSESGGTLMTQRGTALGTALYMPPEQVRDAVSVRETADLFSVGITLYYLLTGKFPYNFPTPFELKQLQMRLVTGKSLGALLLGMVKAQQVKQPMYLVLTEEPIPIRERNPNITVKLASVVDHSIKKEINQRYQSAKEFREELLNAK
jgi:serine/threonine-protein kinase